MTNENPLPLLRLRHPGARPQGRVDSCPRDGRRVRASGTPGRARGARAQQVAVAKALNVPLLVELNAPLAIEQTAYRGNGLGDLGAQAERWTLGQADAVLAVSAPLRDHVLDLGIDPAKVHVIPNGVNTDLFQP